MAKFKFAFFTFPLTKGKETGRGLERVIDELYIFFRAKKYRFDYLDLGFIKNELQAIFLSRKYLRQTKNITADCYFAVYPVSGIFPALAKKRPLVTAIHDMVPYNVFGYSNRIKYSFKRWCIKYSAIKSDHIIVGFRSNKEQLKELFNLPDEKFTIIPYAVNHKTYYLDRKIKKVPGRIAFLGEAKRSKGMDTAIYAFLEVIKKHTEAKLVLASRGAEFEKMKTLARKILPVGSYEFVGFVPERKMREFYARTEVFLFPSRYGFGLSSLESAACGTPAIAGDTLDASDFWKDRDLLVNPEKPKELAKKILKLLDDKDFYQEKRQELLKIAKNYRWEKYSQAHYKLFEKLSKISK